MATEIFADCGKSDGGPAFPAHGTMGEVIAPGMSLRDYFAAETLPAFAALHSSTNEVPEARREWRPDVIADWAYRIADAMLARRLK